jgi:hypothetical protein
MAGLGGRIGALVLLAMSCVPAAASPTDAGIQDFTRRVHSYMELRQRVAKDLPPLQVSSDWQSIEMARKALAHALRRARPHAAMGDIFTADAAPALRRRIADVLRERGVAAGGLLADLHSEAPAAAHARVMVNARFDWSLGALMPGDIIAALPPLPDELQYRFVSHNLVLLDCDAGLIVDVLPQALASE